MRTTMLLMSHEEMCSGDRVPGLTEFENSVYPELRRICCCVSDDRIVLSGTVPSFYLKQMAQCLLFRRFGGRRQVDNQLKVMPTDGNAN